MDEPGLEKVIVCLYTDDRNGYYNGPITFPAGILIQGANVISYTVPQDTGAAWDTGYTDWLDIGLRFPRNSVASCVAKRPSVFPSASTSCHLRSPSAGFVTKVFIANLLTSVGYLYPKKSTWRRCHTAQTALTSPQCVHEL